MVIQLLNCKNTDPDYTILSIVTFSVNIGVLFEYLLLYVHNYILCVKIFNNEKITVSKQIY